MSHKAILEIPNVVVVSGAAGVQWRDDVNDGEWLVGTDYLIRDGVFRDPSSFRAIADHTASAETEPGVGANWRDVWRYLARCGGTEPEPTDSGTLDFSQPQNSGLLALLEDI